MPILDFTEIPRADTGGPLCDAFEMFARDVLEFLGYKVVSGPDRGADGGRDLIVDEVRTGPGGETRIRWLVSCKHNAVSGAAVKPDDEREVQDRVGAHACSGFIGFYSTIPSSGLRQRLDGLARGFECQVFDREKIEAALLKSPNGIQIAERYFPVSMQSWRREHPRPADLWTEIVELSCLHCGKRLLGDDPSGIVVFWSRWDSEYTERDVVEVYCCCKGNCDRILAVERRGSDLTDSWLDLPDLLVPTVFLRWVMVVLNQIWGRRSYSQQAFEAVKTITVALFPYVSRDLTTAEKETLRRLLSIPSFFGGLGEPL